MPSNIARFFSAILLLLGKIAYSSTTYYVDVAGSDANPGTAASPFQTLQFAANTVNPGDTVIVRDGQYTTDRVALIDMYRSGAKGQPITFMSEHPLGAKLDGNSNTSKFGILIEPGVSHLRFSGFDIANFERAGINSSPQTYDIYITNNNIHDIGRLCTDSEYANAGIHLSKTSTATIINNNIHTIGRYVPGENGCYPAYEYYKDYGRGISLDGANRIEIKKNVISDVRGGWGIHIYSGSATLSTKVTMRNNKLTDTNAYYDGQILIAHPGLTASRIVRNIFDHPNNQALYFLGRPLLKNVSVTANRTVGAVISKTRPKGVRFIGNITVRK
jgi:hypothetical protein